MADTRFQSDQEATGETGRTSRVDAAKPYLAAVLIVTVLLTVWVGLCAA